MVVDQGIRNICLITLGIAFTEAHETLQPVNILSLKEADLASLHSMGCPEKTPFNSSKLIENLQICKKPANILDLAVAVA